MKTERNHRTTAQSAGADTIRLRQIRKNCKDRMPPLYVPIRRSEALTEHNSGCKQRKPQDVYKRQEVQYIKVSMASCSFRGVDAEPLRIEVSTSPAAWNAEPSATWIRIVEKTDNALLLTVDDNMSAAERTGEVTITAGQAEQSIKIIQVTDHTLQSTYNTTGEFTMGAVISPNARYVGGYTCIYDTEAGNWVNQVVIIDIRNDKKYMLDPFPDTLYPPVSYTHLEPCSTNTKK